MHRCRLEGAKYAVQTFFGGFRYLFAPFKNASDAGLNIKHFAGAILDAEFELEKWE